MSFFYCILFLIITKLCISLIIREDNVPLHRLNPRRRSYYENRFNLTKNSVNYLNYPLHSQQPTEYRSGSNIFYQPLDSNQVFDANDDDDDDDTIVVEAANGTDTSFHNDPNFMFSSDYKSMAMDGRFSDQSYNCMSSGSTEGACYTNDICRNKGGKSSSLCSHDHRLSCCYFEYTCGGSSSERVTYFESPNEILSETHGSITCDYHIIIQKDVCAVRVDYVNVNLARKLGGVCDVDQLYILNSVDGPTVGQCGPLSGYSTTVAVKPNQENPLKIALLIQNGNKRTWKIKVTQMSCHNLQNFKAPPTCGAATKRSVTHLTPSYSGYPSYPFQRPEERTFSTSNANKYLWWNFPEPLFNMYHYRVTKKYMQQKKLLQPFMKHEIPNVSSKIVGGSEIGINEFPWQVAIAVNNMFVCGGVLINEMYVLTAAHCVMTRDTRKEDLLIYLGDHDLTMANDSNHIVRGISTVMYHSHFHPFFLTNDIALLQLDGPVMFTNNIQPICLPNPNESYVNKKATVVGWGITSFPMGKPSSVPQKIQVELISNYHCSKEIEETIGAGMLCAASASLQGTCFGDSGGPLSVETDGGRNVLVGLVSYGLTGCALAPPYPDIYTRVSEYMKWIDVNTIHRV